jgi:hypothetical protein
MSLPGAKLDTAPFARLAPVGAALAPTAGAASASGAKSGAMSGAMTGGGREPAGDARAEIARLRGLVAECLAALAKRIDETLPAALAQARRAWDKVDDLSIIDPPLRAALADGRRWLAAVAADGGRAEGAVALEGLIALESAWGLTLLAERRLSALIRLRVRSADGELLPGGRPFLDLGAALAEAASAWT